MTLENRRSTSLLVGSKVLALITGKENMEGYKFIFNMLGAALILDILYIAGKGKQGKYLQCVACPYRFKSR